jgi:hypothetical protein
VSDLRRADAGSVISWGLVIQFAGDTPSASRPPTGEKRQIIAAAGHVPGANGTFWVTDLRLFAARETTATLIFTASGQDGRNTFASVKVHVPGGTTVALNDVVAATFGTSGTGQIEIQGEVVATSRTFTRDGSGSYGQFIPAIADGGATAEFLPRIESSDEFRSNVGFAETSGKAGTVRVRLFDADRVRELSVNQYLIDPFGHVQFAASGGLNMTAEIEVVAGEARVLAYVSIIDNRSGDPTYIRAPRTARGVAPVITSPGPSGTYWRSSVWLGPLNADLRYTDSGDRVTQVLPTRGPGELPRTAVVWRADDVLRDVFSRFGATRGVIESTANSLYVTQRIYTTGPRGTYGQSVPLAEPYTGSREILHIENSQQFRTNLGIVTGDGPAIVQLIVFDAAGRELARSEHPLASRSLEQFTLQQSVTNGRVHVDVLSGSAYVYASVVDNQSGDPIFVPAQ